jgi:hypothetical protein
VDWSVWMGLPLQAHFDVLEGCCERLEFHFLGIDGGSNGPRNLPHMRDVAHIVSLTTLRLSTYMTCSEPDRAYIRMRIVRLASSIVGGNTHTDMEERAAEIRSDRLMQDLIKNELVDTFDFVLNWFEDPQDFTRYYHRYAVSVMIEDILADALGVCCEFKTLETADINQSALTHAINQIWLYGTTEQNFTRLSNFLRLVQSSIHPGSLDQFRDTLETEDGRRFLHRCIIRSGVSAYPTDARYTPSNAVTSRL